MKTFHYRLAQLKQVRHFELEAAVQAWQALAEQITQCQQQIADTQQAVSNAQQDLLAAERKQGQLQPDWRRMTAAYVERLAQEVEQLQTQLQNLETQQQQAYAALLVKKQEVKMLEKHEQRQVNAFQVEQIKTVQKHSDDLWLARLGGSLGGAKL